MCLRQDVLTYSSVQVDVPSSERPGVQRTSVADQSADQEPKRFRIVEMTDIGCADSAESR